LVSGSIAFDRIMEFPGRFSEHFVADRLDNINVSLMVSGLTENLGGTAGNIAYSLSLLGEKPRILACVGRDHQSYFDWLGQHGISTQDIRVVSEEWTASAYITTDRDGNQFTAFNPGAMMHASDVDLTSLTPADTIAIVGPGNLQDMVDYPRRYQEAGIYAIFDPGQSLPAWNGPDLTLAMGRCKMLVSNDYELGMITNTTGLDVAQLLGIVDKPFPFVGVMGSHAKISEITKQLKNEGISDKQLSRFTAPVGLPMVSNTPEEIAISVAAQLLQNRNNPAN